MVVRKIWFWSSVKYWELPPGVLNKFQDFLWNGWLTKKNSEILVFEGDNQSFSSSRWIVSVLGIFGGSFLGNFLADFPKFYF